MMKPGKIICVGRNYVDHAKELGNQVPKEPLIFLKPPSSVIPGGEKILLPPQSSQVEFEGEIGIVIAKRAYKITPFEVVPYIKSIVAVNDVTARDLQKSDGQWTRAKGFDTFCPIGEESSEVPDLSSITVITRVNGEERQKGSSSEMVFSIPRIVSYISQVMTLEPGDVIATGTPAGVGPLKKGDMVEVEVVGLSAVRNPVM